MNTATSTLTSSEERLIRSLQLLGDKTRFKMFKLLSTSNGNDLCVSQIAEHIGISVSAVSQHFRDFELLGIVGKTRKGQKICYQLKDNDELVNELIKISKKGEN